MASDGAPEPVTTRPEAERKGRSLAGEHAPELPLLRPADPSDDEVVLVLSVIHELQQGRPLPHREPREPVLELERGHLDAGWAAGGQHRVRGAHHGENGQGEEQQPSHLTSSSRRYALAFGIAPAASKSNHCSSSEL